ncbi:MAG: acyl-CoA dehydrogenase family protein, partial [Actinomycetota bacterium]
MTTVDTAIPAVDELLVDSAQRLFADTATFDAVQAAEAEGWSDPVWNAVAEAGFAWIGLPVDAGGSGGSLSDACEVVRIGASFAAPVPLAETALLGGWLLTEAGLELPDGAVTVIPGVAGDTLTTRTESDGLVVSGTAQRVPWAARADLITAVVDSADGAFVVAVPPAAVRIEGVTNVAGEPRETVH